MLHRKTKAFSVVELMVVIALAALMLAVTLPAATAARERGSRVRCAANLRSIGQGLALYANENRNMYPRVAYDIKAPTTSFTQDKGKDPFALTNDISAGLFMLVRYADMTPEAFVCPTTPHEPDTMDKQPAMSRVNFTSARNLSYSYANPYPNQEATETGYRLNNSLAATFAVCADSNPGGKALVEVTAKSAADAIRQANSKNHLREGQNVLYGDGHVEWTNTPLCGVNRDNIYTRNSDKEAPSSKYLPSPAHPDDSVLLPVCDLPDADFAASATRPSTRPVKATTR